MKKRPCKHNIQDVQYVTCPYCNKSGFKMLHWGHLSKVHNKCLEDVLLEFPNIPTMTKKESDRRSEKRQECNKKITETCNKKYGGVGFKSKILENKSRNEIEKRYGHRNIMKTQYGRNKFIGDKNPLKDQKAREKLSKSLKGKPSKLKGRTYVEIHGEEKAKELIEEKRISGAYGCSLVQNPSKPQVELYNLTKEYYPNSIINLWITEVNRCIDIAIPEFKIAIEYDSAYYHQSKENDDIRQKEIENFGWKFIRYFERIPSKEELLQDIQNII
jgi:hypothetical protein